MTTTTEHAQVTPRSYHLSPEEIAQFDSAGYLVLKNRIPADLLSRLQQAADRWISDGESQPEGELSEDYRFANRPTGRALFRVDYLHDKGEAASLELLGSPAILGIAESLAGPNFVPTYESLVFKKSGDGAPINWHQDAVHPRTARIFNVDIYLDASRKGEGALRVAPGSQKQQVDICQLEEEYGWDAPGVIQVEMEPGDILVHDVMIVHGSEAVIGNHLRRTLYYEFRPAEQILSEGPWDAAWVSKRLRLIPLGLEEYARKHETAPLFTWNVSSELKPEVLGDAQAELRVVHDTHSPWSFCSAGSVPTPTN